MSNKRRADNSRSKLYDRKCYGYSTDEIGKLIIVDDEDEVVMLIFNWYLQGVRVGVIIKELKQQGIQTFTEKDNW